VSVEGGALYRTLLLEEEGGIFTLTLNQPQNRNALSYDRAEEFQEAIGEVAGREQARVLILTGAGDAFCAGGDFHSIIAEFRRPAVELQPMLRKFYSRFLCLRDLEIPTIAAVNGPAVGAGFSLALACDMRIASSSATFHANFVRIGVHPGMGATYFLPRLVGASRALEILWKGETLSARDALALGLVGRVVEPGRLMEDALESARQIGAMPPRAVELIKRSVYMAAQSSLDEMLERESQAQALCGETREMQEAVRVFLGRSRGSRGGA
jgi:enoyl-CoA hydratase/carnithine racemase